jgi:hypothetical protein
MNSSDSKGRSRELMKSGIPETQTNEESETKHERKQTSTQWKKVFGGAWQDFSPRYFSNLLFLVIGLLVAPAVGVIMNKPKIVIAGFALGVTILIWVGAILLIKHASQTSSQEPPSVSDAEATRRINTPAIPQGDPPAVLPPAPQPSPSNNNVPSNKNSSPPSVKPLGNKNANTPPTSPEEKPHEGEREHTGPISFHTKYPPSTDPQFSNAVELTITTTVELRRVHIVIESDDEIGNAHSGYAIPPNVAAFAFNKGPGFTTGLPNTRYEFQWANPFTPEGPLSVTLWSHTKLEKLRVTALP